MRLESFCKRTSIIVFLLLVGCVHQVPAWGLSSKFRKGDELMARGQYEEAAKYWRKYLSDENPNDTQALLRYGTALSMCKKYDEAEKTFKRALKLSPKDPILLQNMGLLYFRQKRLDDAERYFQKVLAVRDWQPNTNYYLGLICEMRGDIPGAVGHYVREVNANPGNQACWRRLLELRESDEKNKPEPLSMKTALAFCAVCVIISFILISKKHERDRQNRWRDLSTEAHVSTSTDHKAHIS